MSATSVAASEMMRRLLFYDIIFLKRLTEYRNVKSQEWIDSSLSFNQWLKDNAEKTNSKMQLLDNSTITINEAAKIADDWICNILNSRHLSNRRLKLKENYSMKKAIVYIGSFSDDSGKGIYPFELNQSTGELTPVFEPIKLTNPAYLTISSDKRFLYSVIASKEYEGSFGGGVAAFAISSSGDLKLLNTQLTSGANPCYLSVDKRNEFLVAANFLSGSVTVFPLSQDGTIKPRSFVAIHSGSGSDKERAQTPHAHFAAFTPDEKYVYAVDLGLDKIKYYSLDRDRGALTPEENLDISLKPGSGPRHAVFCTTKNILYVIHEKSSEIAVFTCDEGYRFTPRQYISTLPQGFDKLNLAAALHMSQDGRLLYASNRGHDSIAVYRIGSDGLLELGACYSSGGSSPRDFGIDPQGNFLLAANEKSNEVTVLKINHETDALEPTGFSVKIHHPVCFQFNEITE